MAASGYVQHRGATLKKGRHRRFEEARALKHTREGHAKPCPECHAEPGDQHASWCLYEDEDDDLGLKGLLDP